MMNMILNINIHIFYIKKRVFFRVKKFFNVKYSYRQLTLAKLLDMHVFWDCEGKFGNAILELGRVDTLVLTLSKNQAVTDLKQIPDNRGSTLYRLLTDPDNVTLDNLSADLFMVRFIPPYSELKPRSIYELSWNLATKENIIKAF